MELQKSGFYKTGIFRALVFFSETLNSDYKQVSCRIHLDNSIPNQDNTEPLQHNPPEAKKTPRSTGLDQVSGSLPGH